MLRMIRGCWSAPLGFEPRDAVLCGPGVPLRSSSIHKNVPLCTSIRVAARAPKMHGRRNRASALLLLRLHDERGWLKIETETHCIGKEKRHLSNVT